MDKWEGSNSSLRIDLSSVGMKRSHPEWDNVLPCDKLDKTDPGVYFDPIQFSHLIRIGDVYSIYTYTWVLSVSIDHDIDQDITL